MSSDFTTPGGLLIPAREIELVSVRAQGPGGQHVNKVSSAIHLRFDVGASSLPAPVRARLLARNDRRLSSDGVLIIKAQNHRSRERNRAEALERLAILVDGAAVRPVRRIATKPGRSVKERRLKGKKQRSAIKQLRRKPTD